MKLHYNKQNGARIKKSRFRCIQVDWGQNENIWYVFDEKSWVKDYCGDGLCSNSQPCKSVKAFNRHLNKLPYGIRFRLISFYVGYDVIGLGKNKNIYK